MAASRPAHAANLRLVNGKRQPRRPARCRICHEAGTPERPLSGSKRHYDCGLLEMAGQARWNALFAKRADPEWLTEVLGVLLEAGRGSLPPSLEAALLESVA